MEIRENVALGRYTTLGMGGPAQYFCRAASEHDLLEAVAWAEGRGLPWFVLGGGSNLLVADRGYAGLVVRVALTGRRELGDGLVGVAAGESWDETVAWCVGLGLAGIECLSGIPGTVGATPVQNVGAYGQEIAAVIAVVRAWDTQARAWAELGPEACGFSYRASRFNRQDRGRFLIAGVRLQLQPGGAAAIAHRELQRRLNVGAATLAEARAAVLAIRREKGMVVDRDDPDSRSAGSFFRNPVVAAARAEALAERHPGLPRFALAPGEGGGSGQVKLSAAWLIEHAGCGKGFHLLGSAVRLSRRHALAIVNDGGGNAAEAVTLARHLRQAVENAFGVRLEVEPEQLGFAPGEAV